MGTINQLASFQILYIFSLSFNVFFCVFFMLQSRPWKRLLLFCLCTGGYFVQSAFIYVFVVLAACQTKFNNFVCAFSLCIADSKGAFQLCPPSECETAALRETERETHTETQRHRERLAWLGHGDGSTGTPGHPMSEKYGVRVPKRGLFLPHFILLFLC